MKSPETKYVIGGRRRMGFALVVTISLMMLLALLGVGLLSLSTIALRGSNQANAMAEARANARLALMLAISQLQESAGPDQRTTAVADIAAGVDGGPAESGAAPRNNEGLNGTAKNLSAVQAGTRYWTGVFRNADQPESIFQKTPTAVADQWLVSGPTAADRQPTNPDCAVGGSGGVGDPDKAALLVGPATVGTGAGTLDRYVTAPIVNVKDDQRQTGAFAWWVGDEGVKARLDMRRIPAGANQDPLLVAQRRGWETVDGFDGYPAPVAERDAELTRISSLPTAPLLMPELTTGSPSPLQLAFHSATVNSRGVIADTLNGGTRVDLTKALSDELPASLSQNVYDNNPVANGRVIPDTNTAHPGLNRLRWERLRDFHQLHDGLKDGALQVRQGSDYAPTVAPTVLDFRILMGVRLTSFGREGKYRLSACGKFAVAIANPYNVPLKWDKDLEFEIKNMTPLGNKPSRIWQHQTCVFIPADATPDSPGGESAVFNQAMFTIPAGELEPGEARPYTNAGRVLRRQGAANAPATVMLAPFGSSSPFDFNNCVEMETGVEVTLPRGMDVRESWQTTLVMLEMRVAGSRGRYDYLRRYHGFELDNGYFSPNTRRFETSEARNYARGPVPLMLYSFQLSQPGMDYEKLMPNGYEIGQRASAIRTYTDFNLQATDWVDAIASYNPPPFFMESNDSIAQLGTTAGETGPGFTRNLAFSPLNWGYSMVEGSDRVVLFDVPERLTSLAQFQHADLTNDDEYNSVSVQPGNAFANSYATTFVRRDTTRQQRTDYVLMGSLNQSGAYQTKRNYYDMSHILNTALWDRYYFSTLRSSSTEPDNPTILVLDDSATTLGDPVKITASLMIDGAFNINSTDKDAWKAMLASARYYPHEKDNMDEAAFPRTTRQPEGAELPPSGRDNDSYAGIRRLTDEQIDALAGELVRQVRLRGPFVSLSHFVNRALVPMTKDAELGRCGPLQAAIDEAGLNISADGRDSGFGRKLSTTDDQVTFAWKQSAPRADLDGGDTGGRPADANSREPDWAMTSRDNNFGAVASIVADREMVTNPRSRREQGYRSTGIPGWLTQADVLQVIGASIAARSDTFRIRTMGQARDAAGNVTAVAYCEAIVQRMPEYVDPADPAYERGDALTPANRTYGRRFTISSFRWLASSEI
jgi:hypothetical protein